MRSVILGAMNYLILLLFGNYFLHCNIILVVDTVSPERIISCLIPIFLLLKSSSCSMLLNSRVDRSD